MGVLRQPYLTSSEEMNGPLPSLLFRDILAHAGACHPNEACGVLLAEDGQPVLHIRMRNVEASPRTYRFDDHEWLRVWRQADADGLQVWGIWHSHPGVNSVAYPSRMDIMRANMPELVYGVLARNDLRFYRIVNGVVSAL